MTANALLNEYRFRSVTDTTAIYGIVGGSVAHSVSPAMHNAAFAAAGIDAVYLPLPAVDADDFLAFGRAIGDQRRERHDSSQGRRCSSVSTRSMTIARRIGAHQHDPRRRRPMDGAQHRRDRVPAAAAGSRRRSTGGARPILGAGGAARAVAVALRVERLQR